MLVVKQIPNLVTLLNLLTGCFALLFAFENEVVVAGYLIFVAAAFDFLDGLLAKMLNAKSNIGKYLDSFADLISFGLVPAAILYRVIFMALKADQAGFNFDSTTGTEKLILSIPFIISTFAAIRLAIFTANERQKATFIGMPTPAMAMLVASVIILVFNQKSSIVFSILPAAYSVTYTPSVVTLYYVIPFVLFLSALMILPVNFFSLKFDGFSLQKNILRYVFLFFSVVLISILQMAGMVIVLAAYILISLFTGIQKKPVE